VLQDNPNWVVVETWDELYEGTGICRTVEYGDMYINLTGQFSQLFHALPLPTSLDEFIPKIPGVAFLCVVISVVGVGIWQWKKTQAKAGNREPNG
jgi:hypothetical protein